jgi:hypothetical protein
MKILLTVLFLLFKIMDNYGQNTFPVSGNAGIGTTTPGSPLQVNGSVNDLITVYGSGLGRGGIYIQNTNPAGQSTMYTDNNRGSFASYCGFFSGGTTNSNPTIFGLSRADRGFMFADGASSLGLGVGTLTSQPLVFGTGNLERMRVDPAGNVGIGTTTPSALLTVTGGSFTVATNPGQYTLAGVDNSSTSPLGNLSILGLNAGDLMIRSYFGVSIDLNNGSLGDNANALYTRIPATSSFTINSRSSTNAFNTLFAVRNNGNVLIGKTSQTNTAYKLDVAGIIRANQVVVNTTGADYVFDSSYRLYSLSNLEKYIEQNHHLPEIVSAEKMQAEGLNVGENQTKLLQKIEELTLYAIYSDKHIKKEEAVISQQQILLLQLHKQLKLQQQAIEQLRKQLKNH